MADRTVLVRLAADVRGFVAGFDRAGAHAEKFGKGVAGAARENEQAFTTLGTTFLGVGTALAAGVGVAVAASAKFEQQMSAVQVATGATGAELDSLRDAAMQAGRDTAFSAQEAAEGVEQLAKAGVSAADITGGALTGALDLAAAGSMSVADAAETTAITLKQFGLEGDRASSVADALAAGANLAVGDVSDLGYALSQGALVANSLGISMEETTGTLAAFAAQGLLGSDAGTSLKTMLQQLNSPVAAVQNKMAELGIEVFDSSGKFIGLAGVAAELQEGMAHLTDEQRTQAMATIFGSDAVRAANVLFAEGSDGIQQWTENVSQSGFAAEQAAGRLDNLAGDLQILRGSVETFFIEAGASSQGPLRNLVQTLTVAVNAFGDLSPSAQEAALQVTGASAGIALAGGAALIAVPKMVECYDALGKMGSVGVATQGRLKGLGTFLANPYVAAVGAAVAIVGGDFVASHFQAKRRVEDLSATLDKATGAVTELTGEFIAGELETLGLLEAADTLGVSMELVTSAAMGQKGALDELFEAQQKASRDRDAGLITPQEALAMNTAYNDIVNNVDAYGSALDGAKDRVMRVKEATDAANTTLGLTDEATGEAADGLNEAASAMGGVAMSAEEAADAAEELIDTFATMAGIQLSARDAARQYEAALDGFTEAIEASVEAGVDQADMFDISTEAGRSNQAALDDIAGTANDVTTSILETAAANGTLEQGLTDAQAAAHAAREAFIAAAVGADIGEGEARAMAEALIAIPSKTDALVDLLGADVVQQRAAATKRAIEAIDSRTVTVTLVERRLSERGVSVLPESVMSNRRFARGGFAAPGLALVGEDGPELVDFRSPARVYTAQQTAAALSAAPSATRGGGGAVSRNEITVRLTGDLVNVLRTEIATRGGDPVTVLGGRR